MTDRKNRDYFSLQTEKRETHMIHKEKRKTLMTDREKGETLLRQTKKKERLSLMTDRKKETLSWQKEKKERLSYMSYLIILSDIYPPQISLILSLRISTAFAWGMTSFHPISSTTRVNYINLSFPCINTLFCVWVPDLFPLYHRQLIWNLTCFFPKAVRSLKGLARDRNVIFDSVSFSHFTKTGWMNFSPTIDIRFRMSNPFTSWIWTCSWVFGSFLDWLPPELRHYCRVYWAI